MINKNIEESNKIGFLDRLNIISEMEDKNEISTLREFYTKKKIKRPDCYTKEMK